MKNNITPKILLDADVVRHFIKGGQINVLTSIFPGQFVMLDIVRDELLKSEHLRTKVNNFLEWFKVPVEGFPTDREIKKEYANLKKLFDDGESACMAVAKYRSQYIASSNLKDIKSYCEANHIVYYTTLDLLVEAFNQNILSENDCDIFIQQVRTKGSKLPDTTISNYIISKK